MGAKKVGEIEHQELAYSWETRQFNSEIMLIFEFRCVKKNHYLMHSTFLWTVFCQYDLITSANAGCAKNINNCNNFWKNIKCKYIYVCTLYWILKNTISKLRPTASVMSTRAKRSVKYSRFFHFMSNRKTKFQ